MIAGSRTRLEGSPFSTVEVQVAPATLGASERPRPLDISAGLLAAARAHSRLVHDAVVPARELREQTNRTLLSTLLSTLHEQEITRTDLSTKVDPLTMLDEQLWRLLAPLVENFEFLPSLGAKPTEDLFRKRRIVRVQRPEMARQELDVLRTLAERRQEKPRHREAKEEVVAEATRSDLGVEIATRRRDHAHVDLNPLVAADAAHLLLLDRAQETRLEAEIESADLVDEERAAACLLEDAGARAVCAGIGAALVSEERALGE